MVMMSGSTPACSIANMLPGAGKAALDLVGHQHDAVLVADLAQRLQEVGVGAVEAALALHRLDDDRGHPLRFQLGLEQRVECVPGLLQGHAVVGDRIRQVVDAGGQRAETGLVRHHLAGERQPHHGAAVEGAGKRQYARSAGVGTRNLHRVLDRLGAGGQEQGLAVALDRRQLVQALGQFDIDTVGIDLEAGVAETGHLLADRRHHLRVQVAGIEHRDAAGEIDVGLAFGVPHAGVLRALDEAWQQSGHAAHDSLFPALLQGGVVLPGGGLFWNLFGKRGHVCLPHG